MNHDPYRPLGGYDAGPIARGPSSALRIVTAVAAMATGAAWTWSLYLTLTRGGSFATSFSDPDRVGVGVVVGLTAVLFLGLHFLVGVRLLRGGSQTGMFLWLLVLGLLLSGVGVGTLISRSMSVEAFLWIRSLLDVGALIVTLVFRRALPPSR